MEPVTCERIITRADEVLRNNSSLGDFDIVHAPGDVNKSPVMLVEDNLALASWCVKHVYSHAYRQTLDQKDTFWRHDECESINRWTQFCLLVRPEVCTFWNLRRKLIKKGLVTTDRELLLTRLILSRKPKCMEAFFQRQWVYNCVLDLPNSGFTTARVNTERGVCTWASNRHQNNYHAWNHRLWLLRIVTSHHDCLPILKREFEEVKAWTSVHISEHSGLHYMNKLVEFIITCSQQERFQLNQAPPYVNNPQDVYDVMLQWNKSLIVSYPGHEALFCARKTLLLKWKQTVANTRPDLQDETSNEDTTSSVSRSSNVGYSASSFPIHSSSTTSSNNNNSSFLDSSTLDATENRPSSNNNGNRSSSADTSPITSTKNSTIATTPNTTCSSSSSSRSSTTSANKSKELRCSEEESTGDADAGTGGSHGREVSSVKRACLTIDSSSSSSSSAWSTLLLAEHSFLDECVQRGDTEYDRSLSMHYRQVLARL